VIGTPDDQTLDLLDREKGAVSDRMWTNPGPKVGTPANEADCQTMEADFNRRFKGRWMLMASIGNTRAGPAIRGCCKRPQADDPG